MGPQVHSILVPGENRDGDKLSRWLFLSVSTGRWLAEVDSRSKLLLQEDMPTLSGPVSRHCYHSFLSSTPVPTAEALELFNFLLGIFPLRKRRGPSPCLQHSPEQVCAGDVEAS